jgi:hypothetical protein
MIIIFANVIFFIVVQTFFFKYIASKQFNVVLADKMGILNTYLKYDSGAREKVEEMLGSEEVAALKAKAKEQEKDRNSKNWIKIESWIGPVALAALVVMATFIFLLVKSGRGEWTSVDTSILTLVVGAYTTEIMFYMGIVRQYAFYGDQNIYATFYNNLHNTVNKEPITPEGKQLLRDIKEAQQTENGIELLLEKHKDLKDQLLAQATSAMDENKGKVMEMVEEGKKMANNLKNSPRIQKLMEEGLKRADSLRARAMERINELERRETAEAQTILAQLEEKKGELSDQEQRVRASAMAAIAEANTRATQRREDVRQMSDEEIASAYTQAEEESASVAESVRDTASEATSSVEGFTVSYY